MIMSTLTRLEGELMLIVGQKRDPLVEVKHNGWVKALTFSANGEYLLGGGENGVQVWQVDDGK